MRSWIHRADAGDPAFELLKPAIIRVGRSVLIDEVQFIAFLRQHAGSKPAPARRVGPRTRGDE